ncbi:hypothetical protein C8P66_105152 [Humitalea rosea]|uniref:Porin-like protein n=1 Tax=Humitalea rosea TaxID=990373 RepID=A0A2W7IN72_9PROT|nr:hypothetical protein [Humitalea rosea]PZW48403.1 hypothetical protein C8P66_105152 [Humitalea rosea]
MSAMRPLLAVLLPALLAAAPLAAQEMELAPGVTLGGNLEVEMDLDVLGRRGASRAHASAYNKTALGLYLNLPGGFTVNGVFKFEPTDRERSAADRGFADQAAWVDELTLSWVQGPLELFGGKIHPRFGFAWDRAPGLYGTDIAEGYELAEKLGFGAQLAWSDLAGLTAAYGEHDLRFEMFQADRSFLSESGVSPRYATVDPQTGDMRYLWRNRRSTGGADNTRGTNNWVASAAGHGMPLPLGTLDYTLGYSSRRAGDDSVEAGTAATETGTVAGLAWEVPLPFRVTATPLVEWTRLDNADGVRDAKRDVVTAGIEVARRPFTVAYAYAVQRDTGPTPYDATQHSASVSYDLGNAAEFLKGFEWTVGWRRLREDGVSANDFGTQLVYAVRF